MKTILTLNHRRSLQLTLCALVVCSAFSTSLAQDRFREEDDKSGANARWAPPDQRPGGSKRWTLGVQVETLGEGQRVTAVSTGSAAERAGLERGDIIITVNGYQIGRVGGRIFDIGNELQLRADAQGRVTLLIQDRRNGKLKNVDVRLDRDGGGSGNDLITGTATYRERITTPPGAVLVLRLVERGKWYSGSEVIAERRLANLGNSPIRFELPFDLNKIETRKRYELKAEILVNGRVWMSADRDYPVLTEGYGNRVDIQLRSGR